MTDIWVCSTCHSINRQRNTRCYKCGASQAEATGEGATLRVESALQSRIHVRYRSAWLRGVLASICIIAFAAVGVLLLLGSFDDAAWVRDQLANVVAGGQLDSAGLAERTEADARLEILRLGLAITALGLFAAWLSRVVMNIPALGGGVPSTTPTRAFIYPLIPIWNLFKVPGILQDALYRVEPRAGGFFMVAIAWFGLVGSWFLNMIGGWLITAWTVQRTLAAETEADLTAAIESSFDLFFGLSIVCALLVAGGAIVVVMLMMRIERRSAARDREIRAAASAPTSEADTAAGPQTDEPPIATLPTATGLAASVATTRTDDRASAPLSLTSASQGPDATPRPLAPAPVTTSGPHLLVSVEAPDRIVAELDGEREVVSLDALRGAAAALARAGGNATVSAVSEDAETRYVAQAIVATLRSHGVPTAG